MNAAMFDCSRRSNSRWQISSAASRWIEYSSLSQPARKVRLVTLQRRQLIRFDPFRFFLR
jgi:hypothetical protein